MALFFLTFKETICISVMVKANTKTSFYVQSEVSLVINSNPREMFNAFTGGLQSLSKTNGEQVRGFMDLLGACYKPGALDLKTKELMSVAIAVYCRCEYCIVFHVHKALEAGAGRAEILEAAMVAVAFGGGPAMTYSVTLLKESLDEFEPDFTK